MVGKKIKLDESAISEILVADTDSESGAEATDLEDEFSESKELEASAQGDEPQAATIGGGSPTWGTPQGRNKKIHHKETSPKLQQVAEGHKPGERLKEHKNPSVCWSSKRLEKQ